MVEVCLTLTLTPKIEESLSPSERAITATQISSNTISGLNVTHIVLFNTVSTFKTLCTLIV